MAKIPSHDKNSFLDKQSISLIENILSSHGRVMPKLESSDKWPNIDGHVEVQNEQNVIIGRIYAQAKTLPAKHKLKFSCPVAFLSNCELDPCLLFGVDNENSKVYWLYFDALTVKKFNFKKNLHSKIISFDKDQYFDKQQKSYISEWIKIVRNNQYKFKNFDDLKTAYDAISQNSNVAVGKEDKQFSNMHIFLDSINNRFDNEFKTTKNLYYPKTWKLGMATYHYDPSSVSYTLYPISYSKNDVQIKTIDKVLHDKIQAEGLGFTAHSVENPIESRPIEYADEIVASKTLKIVDGRLLKHSGINFLANEYIFSFIDKFHEQLGLKIKDTYSLAEIQKGFYEHLPLWLIEGYKILKSRNSLPRKAYFDPDVISFLRNEERQEILKSVSSLLANKTQTPQIHIGNHEMPLGILVEFIEYLQNYGGKISRPYKQKDFSRLEGKTGWVWSVFSKNDADYNLRIFFKELPDVYQLLLRNNFPIIEKELSLFGKASMVVVSWTVRDEYQGYETGPTYRMFYLLSDQDVSPQIITDLAEDEAKLLSNFDFSKPEINFRGKNYKVLSYSSGALDFIYEDTPILNFIYKILKDRLETYFKN